MRRRWLWGTPAKLVLFGLVLVFLNASCGPPAVGDAFTIRLGGWTVLPDEDLRLAYLAVLDERCPPGEACASAGRAIVTMSYARPSAGPAVSFTMDVVKAEDVTFGGHRVDYADLSPSADFLTLRLGRSSPELR
ncbi:hypothetical protein SAMN04489729_5361 [Amycolatopsis lurida]|uniref:Uncharacterized protein n=1 Tax=Amycolatopsis lurida NRRL 2430 TaxID=1460371 RepID=A0A2P2FQ61_AMYLU|nr:hypothetical protein [Amycolatopsis lurida]KFU78859.1 hypothetical protein BB31_22805 [Amycolatopsis lurida NRRL 2430]SED81680.1 hypothetical protein SAMN04489729_5361 [Amycolatopsis lurida]